VNRRGMTLVEMLVAMTATLILMGAVTQIFAVFGTAVSNSQSILDTDNRIRVVAWKLRQDLAGATARLLPPLAPSSGEGYFEIIEGPVTDAAAAAAGTVGPADCDDVLLFTTRSNADPFIGRSGTSMTTSLQSPVAEVAWFARLSGTTAGVPVYTLYRRQLLVVGYVGTGTGSTAFSIANQNSVSFSAFSSQWSTFYDTYDLSTRLENGVCYPNTLADLTRRECRFLHDTVAGFPFAFVNHQTATAPNGLIFQSTSMRRGEDVALTNVLGFDVRVFDPGVPVYASSTGNLPLLPQDNGYPGATQIGTGGYVDLGASPSTNTMLSGIGIYPHFSGTGQAKSGLSGGTQRIYDTWSMHYEANGRDEDGVYDPDQGSNGLDDDGDGKIDEPPLDANGNGSYADAGDDPGELETSPPFPYPLRGLEVRIRCLDPESRQVRQVTVRHTFVPY